MERPTFDRAVERRAGRIPDLPNRKSFHRIDVAATLHISYRTLKERATTHV